jgi:hypothetical protein
MLIGCIYTAQSVNKQNWTVVKLVIHFNLDWVLVTVCLHWNINLKSRRREWLSNVSMLF